LTAVPAPPVIAVDRLAKRYGSGHGAVVALRDVTFEAAAGEVLAVLGPNGAGKSTTVRILATLLAPDSGSVAVGGEDVLRRAHAVRSLLGVALQETGTPRWHSARRLLRHHALLHGAAPSEAGRRADELLERFGLMAVADRRVETYSGGERRRLDVALALVHRPPVVLLDEPTAGLDLSSRLAIWRELHAHVEAGATLVFTTHDLREADERASSVAIVDRGVVVAHSTPAELKRRLGSRTLELRFAGPAGADRALELLEGARRTGADSVVLPLVGPRGMLEALRRLETAGVAVEELTVEQPTLETAFATITAGDAS
jgi:ABC-2 type transport system ATP-binding protein